MERKDLYDAIWKRISVRRYLTKHIEEDKISILRRSIASINEESGLNIEFIEDSDSFNSIKTLGMFKNVRSVIAVKGKGDDPNLQEKCGYYGERIVLEATYLELGTCWVAATFNKKSKTLNVKDDETLVCAIPIGYGTDGFSESVDVPDAPHRKTISASEFLDGNNDVPSWVMTAMKAVQFAPTAVNGQKARFSYKDGSLYISTPDGRYTMVDLGIIKLHFELAAGGKFEIGNPAVFTKD